VLLAHRGESEQRERRAGGTSGKGVDRAVVLAAARHSAVSGFDIPQEHEFMRISDRQRPQEEIVDEAEDRRVCADADCQ